MLRVIFQATLACLLLVYAFIQMQGHPTGRGGKAQENSDLLFICAMNQTGVEQSRDSRGRQTNRFIHTGYFIF